MENDIMVMLTVITNNNVGVRKMTISSAAEVLYEALEPEITQPVSKLNEALIKQYKFYRAQESTAKKEKDKIGAKLKAILQESGTIYNEFHHIMAELIEKNITDFDKEGLKALHPELVDKFTTYSKRYDLSVK
jgi:hypothetical protein